MSDAFHGAGHNSSSSTVDDRNCVFNALRIGSRQSTGILRMTNGVVRVGLYGMNVGTSDSANSTSGDCFATGIVQIAGGSLAINGRGACQNGYNEGYFMGTILGDGRQADVSPARLHYGRMEVSGGAFTNLNGHFVVGANCGEGHVVQTGGRIVSNTGSVNCWLTPVRTGDYTTDSQGRYCRTAHHSTMVVGGAGGLGTVDLSGGTFELKAKMCIGGVQTNEYVPATWENNGTTIWPDNWYKGYCFDRHDAVSPIVASESLVISEGASLEVDLSAYAGSRTRLPLVTTPKIEGRFAPDQIKITGAGTYCVRLYQRSSGLGLAIQRGIAVILR